MSKLSKIADDEDRAIELFNCGAVPVLLAPLPPTASLQSASDLEMPLLGLAVEVRREGSGGREGEGGRKGRRRGRRGKRGGERQCGAFMASGPRSLQRAAPRMLLAGARQGGVVGAANHS
eukprot:5199564-Prymnesium_polylepis.1